MGVASHLLIDATNTYGIRLLLPFSSRWSHLDLNSLYDGWILAVLAFAAVWPFFARLVSREIGDRSTTGRGIAIFALVFFVLFDCCRGFLHARVVAQLESRLYNDMPPLQAAALPERFTPFRWTGIVETVNDFRLMGMDAFGQFDLEDARLWYKPALTPSLENAKATEAFRFFLYFARFPVWSEQVVPLKEGQGKRVELTDLRFGTPGAGAFHCIALQDEKSQVLQSVFTYGSGANLGWNRSKAHDADSTTR
jgi:inner membrane protein